MLMVASSPTRFHHAGDFALAGQFTETDAANFETADVGVPTSAILATVVLPRFEFGGPPLFDFPSYFRHSVFVL
jgi:hypothetical protein